MPSNSVATRAGPLRAWVPSLVLILSITLTIVVTRAAASAAETRDRLRFEAAVQLLDTAIKNRMEAYIAMLLSGKGLFAASERVTRAEFHSFVERMELLARFPGVQGIGYSTRFDLDERGAVVAQMRAEGAEDFALRPPGDRDEYHPVVYLEPLDRRNKAAIGYDMFSEPVRRAAIERAREAGVPTATGRITLVQEVDEQKQAGFLIYVPVYRNDMPIKTAAERREAHAGFVYSPFRADDLMRGILSFENAPTLDVQIFDGEGTAPEDLLHTSSKGGGAASARQRSASKIEIAGRTWTVVATTRPEFEVTSTRGAVPYVFLAGSLVGLVLYLVTRSQARARALAESSAVDLAKSERSLRESEQHLRELLTDRQKAEADRLQAEKERAKLDEEIIRMQAARLEELSTPLIPLSSRVLLMPLVGTIDARRAEQVREAVAVGVASKRARIAILDITGVPNVDTQVASVLVQAAQVVRLLGAEVVLTGINAAVAQTLARIGVDLSGVVTRGDLQSGIEYAMRRAERGRGG